MFSDVLLTVDYDRTLTDPDSRIPERNLRAIRFFMENGGTFTVNTGRSVPAIASFKDKVPVNAPFLVYNGAAFYDVKTGELTNVTPIALSPEEVIADIQQRFPDMTTEVQGVSAHFSLRENPAWERYSEYNGIHWEYTTPDKIEQPFMKFVMHGAYRSDRVSSIYEATEEELRYYREVTAYVMEKYGRELVFYRACARLLDFQAKGVSKIAAARRLQEQFHKKILVCAGDGENDVAMLSGADYAYSPADGVVADRYENVCPCAQGSVADVILKKIPGILGSSLDIPAELC